MFTWYWIFVWREAHLRLFGRRGGVAGFSGLVDLFRPVVPGLPVPVADGILLLVLQFVVEAFQPVDVTLGEHGDVNRLGERAADVRVTRVSRGAREEFPSVLEAWPSIPIGRDSGENLADGGPVLFRGL
jgi:hypothetical protein